MSRRARVVTRPADVSPGTPVPQHGPLESRGAFDYPMRPGSLVDPMMFKEPYPVPAAGTIGPLTATTEAPLPSAYEIAQNPHITEATRARAMENVQMLCIGLGLLKDGRHVAFEAELAGPAVKEWRPLCARPQVDGPERAWWQVGFARLCAKRELLPAEVEANTRDSHGVRPEHFAEGAAVAILGTGRNCTALALRLEGTTVAEPKVVARGAREFCWSELAVWASLNMLPRRRKP